MKNLLRKVLWVLIGLIALNFLVTGLRWAVAPSGAAEALDMSLLNGAGLSTQMGDIGAFFIGMGLFVLLGLVTKKRPVRFWFLPLPYSGLSPGFFMEPGWRCNSSFLKLCLAPCC